MNYDQSGRAYPDKPHIKKNWDCIWEHNGKYYKLVGDDEHKEWKKAKLEAIRDYHQELIDDLKILRTDFNMKMPFYNSRGEMVVGIFASEFKKEKQRYWEVLQAKTFDGESMEYI